MKKIIIHYVPKSHISKDEYLMKQYDILAEETSMRVNLLWSVPSLLFVAISFLLITSWDGNFSPWFRFIASFISAVLCVCIWMLFERLWYFECAANEQMASIEKYFSEKFRWEVPFIHTSITKKNRCKWQFFAHK